MIDKKELENFISNIQVENTNKKEKVFNDVQAEEIIFLKDKKVPQKNIIEFLFNKYPEIKSSHQNKLQSLKSLISKIKKEKIAKRRKSKDENIVNSNSSKPENKEEPENKTSSILPKITDKKQVSLDLPKIENNQGLIEPNHKWK